MYIVLIRHGQSLWNLENRFTGWTDVDLSDAGLEEARQAGTPLVYELDDSLKPIRHYHLGMDGPIPDETFSKNI